MRLHSLIFMKHPPAARFAELGCTPPSGIKKRPPRIFHTAAPPFSFSGFRKIQKNPQSWLFLPDGTGPVPSSEDFRQAAHSPHGMRPTAPAFPARAPAEDAVRCPRQGNSVPGTRLKLQPQQHLNHIFLYAYTLSAVRTPFIGREKPHPCFDHLPLCSSPIQENFRGCQRKQIRQGLPPWQSAGRDQPYSGNTGEYPALHQREVL